MTELIINLPFEGFYESKYSGEVDNIEEREAEYFADERQEEEGVPADLRLTGRDFADILFDTTDYSACYLAIAKAYVSAFNIVASEQLDLQLGLRFESMDSPREYNFTTDRVYAYIDTEVVKALFARSAAEGHARLIKTIKDRFTSYDGFISGYPNRLESWLEKDVTEWDHNELGTLLIAMIDQERRDLGWEIYEAVCDGDGVYSEWSDAVDWPKFDAKVQELRGRKAR